MSKENLSKEEFERDFKLKDTNWFYKGMYDIWSALINASISSAFPVKAALDLGCGAGGKMAHLAKISDKVHGLDLSIEALEFCKREGAYYLSQATVEKLPYKDHVFSIVNAFDVLEHVDDDVGVLKEIHRVLAKEGFLVMAVPAFDILWSQHDIANYHKRRYSAGALRRKLENAGFKVRRMTYANFFLFFPVLIYRIVQYRLLRHAGEFKRTRVENLPGFLNALLGKILKLESEIIRKIDLPCGVALLCVAQKSGLINTWD